MVSPPHTWVMANGNDASSMTWLLLPSLWVLHPDNDLLQDLVIFVMDSSIGQAAHDQAAAFRESVDVSQYSTLHLLFSRACTSITCRRLPAAAACLYFVRMYSVMLHEPCLRSTRQNGD